MRRSQNDTEPEWVVICKSDGPKNYFLSSSLSFCTSFSLRKGLNPKLHSSLANYPTKHKPRHEILTFHLESQPGKYLSYVSLTHGVPTRRSYHLVGNCRCFPQIGHSHPLRDFQTCPRAYKVLVTATQKTSRENRSAHTRRYDHSQVAVCHQRHESSHHDHQIPRLPDHLHHH